MAGKYFTFSFADVEVREREFSLVKAGETVAVEPKAFRVLLILLRNSRKLIPKEELLNAVWGDAAVTENSLTRAIALLRRLLGDDAREPRFIETVTGVGYRWLCEVEVIEEPSASPNPLNAAPATISIETKDPGPGDSTPPKMARTWTAIFATASVLLIAAIAYGVHWYRNRPERLNLEHMQVTRLTDNGRTENIALSPDGRYVAWVSRDGQEQSLWVRQVATGSDIQILPARVVAFNGVSFSADGNYLYFNRTRENNFHYAALYSVPALGGPSVQVNPDSDTTAGFSPDGKQIVFLTGDIEDGVWHVEIAKPDGSDMRILASVPAQTTNVSIPVWSPDGKSIVFSIFQQSKVERSALVVVSAADGSYRNLFIGSPGQRIGQPVWLPDGRGLLAPMQESVLGARGQIWLVSYPGGEVHHFTNDPTDYSLCCMGITADGRTVAVSQNEISADLWVAPAGNLDQARQITSGEPHPSASWSSDGKIITEDADGHIVVMAADGSHGTRLPLRPLPSSLPSACGGGRNLTYASVDEAGSDIWRVDASDGNNPVGLTHSGTVFAPSCSLDGKWVAYSLISSKGGSAMRIPIQGGEPFAISPDNIDGCSRNTVIRQISPDSSMLATCQWNDVPGGPNLLAVLELGTGKLLHRFVRPADIPFLFQWAPDGQGIDYVQTKDGIGNIWEQPLSDGPPKQITHFTSEEIMGFDWSPDGAELMVSRGNSNRNVFLLSNFR